MSGRRNRKKPESNQSYFLSLSPHDSSVFRFRAEWSNNKSMTIRFKKEIIFNFMSHRRFRVAIPLSISTWDSAIGFVFAVRLEMDNGQNSNQIQRNHLLSILFAWLIPIYLFSSMQAINTYRLA